MRALATSVLAFEVIVVLLAVPVAAHAGAGGAAAGAAGAAVALGCLLAIGLLSRAPRAGYGLGWAVQLALVVGSLWAWPLLVLGPLFLALWIAALRFGRKADALRAENTARGSSRYPVDRGPRSEGPRSDGPRGDGSRGDLTSDKEQ